MQINFTPQLVYNNSEYKRENISFKSVYHSKLGKDLLEFISNDVKDVSKEKSLIDTFEQKLVDIAKPSNMVGEGFYGAVYKLDDELLVKISKFVKPILDAIRPGNKTKLKTYYGEPVLEIGNIKVLQNAATTPKSIPAGINGHDLLPDEIMRYYRQIYLKRFSNMPQKAYNALAYDFKVLGRNGKSYDTVNPSNFIADGERIKVVDDIEDRDGRFLSTLAGMMKVFINKYALDQYANYDPEAVHLRRVILTKIILAGERVDLPRGSKLFELEEIDKALAFSDVKEPWHLIEIKLDRIKNYYSNPDERVSRVRKYLRTIML